MPTPIEITDQFKATFNSTEQTHIQCELGDVVYEAARIMVDFGCLCFIEKISSHSYRFGMYKEKRS